MSVGNTALTMYLISLKLGQFRNIQLKHMVYRHGGMVTLRSHHVATLHAVFRC